MPVDFIGAAAALAGAGATAYSASQSGGGGGGGGVPNIYQPGNPAQQDQNYQTLVNQMFNAAQGLPGQLLPGYQQASQNITNNPYAGLQQQGANLASNIGMGTVAPWQFGGAQSLYGGANQLMQQAFDPRQELLNTEQQRLTDQFNAANAASGVSGPLAAGIVDEGLSNFSIDWQNQQLNRMLQGVTGAGRAFAGASDLGGLGLQTLQSSAGAPYNTFLGQQQNILGGLDAFSRGANSAFSLPQQTLGNQARYLQLGQSAGVDALAAQQQGFNQNQIFGQQIANAFSNPSLQSGINQLFAPSGGNSFMGGGNISTGGNVSGFGGLFGPGSASLGQDPFAGLGGGGEF